jgi:Tfp pilus assembly protein PilF
LRIASELGIRRWHVSISHIETHATASAIGLREDGAARTEAAQAPAAAPAAPASAPAETPTKPAPTPTPIVSTEQRFEQAKQAYLAKRYDEAEVALREILTQDPDHWEAAHVLGVRLQQIGRSEEAVAFFRRAVKHKPDWVEAWNNLSVALRAVGDLDEAAEAARRAIAVRPSYAQAHFNLAHVLRDQSMYDEAMLEYERALEANPNYAKAHYSRSMLLLLRGDYERGWPEYEWRWRKGDFSTPPRTFAQPLWDGSPLGDKRILLHPEQGMGDSIQFARYAPMVAERGGHVIVEAMPPLVEVMKTLRGIEQVVAYGDELPRFDVHAPLLSLPLAFRTTLETIPVKVPYLAADPLRVRGWRVRLDQQAPGGTLRVGLNWAGNPNHPRDSERSIPLPLLEPLARIEGVTFVSLQKGAAPVGGDIRMLDWTADLTTFADTAALMENLDLIVTVDTSVAHLAGALARNVWTMLPRVPDWRWMLDREDSPWYPTMRLFRQTTRGDWPGVIQRVAAKLKARVESR